MKFLNQFGIIVFVTFLGEMLHHFIPLPIPASIYGLVLMLIFLGTKLIKLEQVKTAADFFLDIMPPMFIPAAVGLVTAWSDLQSINTSSCYYLCHYNFCDDYYGKDSTGSNT